MRRTVAQRGRDVKDLVFPTIMAGLLSLVASTVCAEVVENSFWPLDGVVMTQECPDALNEDIVMRGSLHIVISATQNGNVVTLREQYQPQDVFGEGVITGDQYVGSGVTLYFTKTSLVNGQLVDSHVDNFLLIGKAHGTKYRVTWETHTTYTAGGEISVTFDNHRIECR